VEGVNYFWLLDSFRFCGGWEADSCPHHRVLYVGNHG
jgi:hypothetical protein